jgi:tetratricopeptide (TPR) repeat protein
MNTSTIRGGDNRRTRVAGSAARRAASLAVGSSLLLLLAACGGSAAAKQSDAQKAGVLLQAGLAAHQAGRTAEAATDYKKVLTYDPKNQWAHYNLGLIEQMNGQNAAAETDYRAALAADPNFVGALYNLAILRSAAAPQDAVDLYRRAIGVTPNMAIAHLNLGFLLQTLGQAAAGKAELDKAVALDPTLKKRLPAAPPPPVAKK